MITVDFHIIREPVNYNIKIERGLVTDKTLPEGYIITDNNIISIQKYTDLIKTDDLFVMDAGEQSKSLENYIKIINHIPRDTKSIIALGGGMVGDLAGFVASTYKRSIPLIQIPTTLLAMVDSSIGGKNGVNLGERKNYLGTINQPNSVFTDINFLKTLPEKEFSNGVAEIIKYGAIANQSLLERMQTRFSCSDEDLEDIIVKCINIKRDFVEEDENDKNIRQVLNFGHTIGHALELLYNLPHGQAIAIGMRYESKLLLSMDTLHTQDIISALEANGLPTKLPDEANIAKIIDLMKADKKGPLIFSFNNRSYHVEKTEEEIRKVLK